jgi:2-polyprenyl-3-methyl-5-hydroxy-6-metoxy-1,4-benzoquinol methylase
MDKRIIPKTMSISAKYTYDRERIDISCPHCKSNDWEKLNIRPPITDSFISICKSCGFISYNPQLPNIVSHYSNDIRPQSFDFMNTKINKLAKHRKLIFKYLKDNKIKPQSVLDYGCSDGYLLEALKSEYKGLKEYGIELNPGHANYAKYYKGLNVTTSVSLDLDDTYDIAVLYHVLEHLQEPDKIIDKLRGLLTDNGLLYLAVPTLHKIIAQYKGRMQMFPEDHINMFTPDTLQNFIEHLGFEKVFEDNILYGTTMIFRKSENKAKVKSYYEPVKEALQQLDKAFRYTEEMEKTNNPGKLKALAKKGLEEFLLFPDLVIKYAAFHDSLDEQDILEEYIEKSKDDKGNVQLPELYIPLAISHLKEQDYNKAQQMIDKNKQLVGDSPKTREIELEILHRTGNVVKYIEGCKRFINESPWILNTYGNLFAYLTKL